MGNEFNQPCGLAMTYSVCDPRGTQELSPGLEQPLVWRSRYDGHVSIAHLGDKAVAGISGPWDGKFALTWWDRPLPSRQLELYDTLEQAKREVEDWALRMRAGHTNVVPRDVSLRTAAIPALKAGAASDPDEVEGNCESAARHISLVKRMCTLLPAVAKPREPVAETIERLRRQRIDADADFGDLHFSARR